MMRWLAMTGLGLGCAPWMPGTVGSAGAIGIALGVWAIHHAAGGGPITLNAAWIAMMLLACIACVKWGAWAIDHFAAKARKPGDPGPVVIDEWAGQWLALVALPMPTLPYALAVLVVQFVLFRLFDVIKLPPARQLERLPAGWGILTDDLAAAVHANVIGQILFRWLLP